MNNSRDINRGDWAQAKRLVEAGRRFEAKPLLQDIVRKDRSLEVLLYLAHTTDNPEDEKEILRAILDIDQGNRIARQWFDSILGGAEAGAHSRVPYGFRRLGKFRVIEKIGSGVMQVFKAVKLLTGQEFAIKALPPAVGGPEFEELLENEVFVTNKLNHEQIVRVYGRAKDFDTGTDYIVLEYVEGQSLASELRNFTISESLEIVKQCCQILEYCHHSKIYHRDLKPSNIMIVRSKDGALKVKLLDFGLATVVRSSMPQPSSKLQIVGTLQYRAPELFYVSPRDELRKSKSVVLERHRELEAIDIYALGVIFYQLLTKVLPFEGSDAQITHDIVHRKPVPPHKKDPSVPKALSRIVMSLLNKKPHARATARQLYKALYDIEAWPEWLSPLAAFSENLVLITFEVILGTAAGLLTLNIRLPPIGAFMVFAFFVLLLGGALCFFLILWSRGIRNSGQLASSGALALISLIAISGIFFSALARDPVTQSTSTVPTADTAVRTPVKEPVATSTRYIVAPPTRTPTVTPTRIISTKNKTEFAKSIDDFFTLEDSVDAIRILTTVGGLFGALMGLTAMPGTSRALNVFLGGVLGAFVGVVLGAFASIALGITNTFENLFHSF